MKESYVSKMQRIYGFDPAAPNGDMSAMVITETDTKGRVRVIHQLYGRPGNVIFPGQNDELDLTKGDDGVWR